MDTSNWLIDQKIMVGGKPYNEDVDLKYLLQQGITVIVNLTTKQEISSKTNYKYQSDLPSHIQYIHFQIKDMYIQSDENTLHLVDNIIMLSKDHKIYIHCKGGHGRTGVIAGLIVHKLHHEWSYNQVIEYVQKRHTERKNKPFSITPQTAAQFCQLKRIISGCQDILFYDKNDPNYIYSNFYTDKNKKPLFVDDKNREWYSSEAYYQAHKYYGSCDTYAEIIRGSTSAHFAYLLGNMGGNIRPGWKINDIPITTIIKTYKNKINIVSNWDNIRESVMHNALLYKFNQNRSFRDMLLSTDDRTLVEFTPRDMFWGTYWNKSGENKLGQLLEKVRSEIYSR